MNIPEESQSTTSEQVVYERCPCQEIVDTVQEMPRDLACCSKAPGESRVEFLKAVREILNERIERLSNQGQKGTKVAVE